MHHRNDMCVIRNTATSDFDLILNISAKSEEEDRAERSLCSNELNEWISSPFTVFSKDFFIAELNGSPIGFVGLEVWPGKSSINRIFARGAVIPDFRRQGVGRNLMLAAEIRAREIAQSLNNNLNSAFDVLCRESQSGNIKLCRSLKMKRVREFSTYQFDLSEASIPIPLRQNGDIKFEMFNQDKDEDALRNSINEAFKSYWSFEPLDEKRWKHEYLSLPYFDPKLWIIAQHQNEIIGFSINYIDPDYISCRSRQEGFISLVGVKEEWRNRGIGKSIVCHSLMVLKQNNMQSAYLYVDQNDQRFIVDMYKKIGFSQQHSSLIYRKML